MPSKAEKLRLCIGCCYNFYNSNNDLKIKECWSLKSAKKVRRWRIGWWTEPKNKDCFYPVTTLSCHQATGRYYDSERLPAHLGGAYPPKEETAKDKITQSSSETNTKEQINGR